MRHAPKDNLLYKGLSVPLQRLMLSVLTFGHESERCDWSRALKELDWPNWGYQGEVRIQKVVQCCANINHGVLN